MRDRIQVLCLSVLLLTVPPVFRSLAATWYPALYGSDAGTQHYETARVLRHKFWRSALMVVVLALMAALGRGGWAIESWKGETLVERIDRGLYIVEQLGAAALLIFALTL